MKQKHHCLAPWHKQLDKLRYIGVVVRLSCGTFIHILQQDYIATLPWFRINHMKGIPIKFQTITFGKRGNKDLADFTSDNTTIHYL